MNGPDQGAREDAVWQLGCGSGSRSYAEVFLKYGIGLIGPGDAERWTPQRNDDDFDGGYVRRFASEIQTGDIILLRIGVATVVAVGRVASEYLYLDQFDDVNGLDLQHARRIRWCPLPRPYAFDMQVFGANPPRCSRVWTEGVVEFAQRFVNSPPLNWQTASLPDLPEEEPLLKEVPAQIRDIVAQAQDILPLYEDGRKLGEWPTEDELVGHFVLPFLRGMGWPPERIAVKWRYIDVAVFDRLPRVPENVRFVVEAKRLGAGVEGALEQAKGYVESLGVLRDVVVTDGIRYRMYSGERGFDPVAYANLVRLKQSAIELFDRLKKPA
jgi:hypothetical protein